MILRELFEARAKSVGIIFGRFNPPHQGHRAAWEMAAENSAWYVGTNKSTQGPKDPLPFDIKVQAMKAVWPEVGSHIVAETSWLTLASKVYEKHGNIVLNVYTDEDWVTKALVQYNGKEGAHGYYEFGTIQQQTTPRLSSATALRAAVAADDRDAFGQAAGVDPNTLVAGHPFFDVVKHYLMPHAEKAAKKKVKEPVAELSNELLGRYKKAAGADAKRADADGDYDRGNKRFSGIVKATKKQFANDEKGVAEGLSKRDQQDVAAIKSAIERLQAQLSHPNADKAAIQQSIAHEKKRLALYGQGVAEGPGFDKWADDRAASQLHKLKPGMVQDRKTGKWYDPNKEFDKKMNSPEVMAQMKRMAQKEGVAEGDSPAMAQAAKRLTDPKDGATAKLRAAGDKRREDDLKSRDIAKKNEGVRENAWDRLQREKALESAGVGIITKQNSTVDVNKNTPKKNLKAFKLI